MSSDLTSLTCSPKFRVISPLAIKVYLALRAEVLQQSTATTRLYRTKKMYVAGEPVQSIALVCGLEDLTVRRVLDELIRAGWTQSIKRKSGDVLYLLGDFKNDQANWLVDCESSASTSTVEKVGEVTTKKEETGLHASVQRLLHQATGEDAKILKEATARRKGRAKTNVAGASESRKVRLLAEVGLITAPEAARRFIAAKWKEMHQDKYNCDPKDWSPKEHTKVALIIKSKQITKWCLSLWKLLGDEKEIVKYFSYVMENWSELRKQVFPDYSDVIPSLAFIVHERVFQQIQGCRVAGIPTKDAKQFNLVDRAAGTDWETEKDVGW